MLGSQRQIKLFAILLCLLPTTLLGAEHSYEINTNIRSAINKLSGDKPFIPDILTEADLRITADVQPRRNYYHADVQLLSPYDRISSFHKEFTLRESGGKIIVSHSVNIKLRPSKCILIERIKQRIVDRIEHHILLLEEKYIKEKLE